jgi:hypothetical protein
MKNILLLIGNALLGVLISILATAFSPSSDPWPQVYLFFPVMRFAGVPGFAVIPVIILLFIAVIYLTGVAMWTQSPEWRKRAFFAGHLFVVALFIIPSIFEAFGDYIGP